jgi:hypothetical protein
VSTFIFGSESNWAEKLFLGFVNAGSGWEGETTPHENVLNRFPIGTVDKNRKGEAMCVGIGAGVKSANEGPAAT